MPLLVALAVVLGQAPAPELATFVGRVVAVADGDTLTVLRDRTEVKIRLHGIDAPESGQDFATAARRHLDAMVAGKTVRVEPMSRDRYGRTVARVRLDGESIGPRMVRDGFAWWFRRYAPGDPELSRAETEARAARRGLWSASSPPVAPWDWRTGKGIPAAIAGKFIASARSEVYHAPGCRSIPRILPTNRLVFGTEADARKAGFRPAKDCP